MFATGLQLGGDTDHLVEIQQALGLKTWTPEAHQKKITEYQDLLGAERRDETIYQQMSQRSIEQFRSERAFKDWNTPGRSAILVLIGVSNENIIGIKRHCWVSPFALDLVGRVSHSATYVFPLQQATSIHDALPVLLFQLLRLKRTQLVGPKREGVLADIGAYAVADNSGEKVNALSLLAKRVVQLFEPQETIYLVLDRVDRCWNDDQYDLMHILVDIISCGECSMKILAVADSTTWICNLRSINVPCPEQLGEVVMSQRIKYDPLSE